MENQIKFDEPKVKVLQNGNLELLADWVVQCGDWWFVVPRTFISDGNSVPWLFRWLVPKFGRNTIAGIVHDWLVKSGQVYEQSPDICGQCSPILTIKTITRRQADMVRLYFCNWCGVHWFQRLCSYLGLRIGGGWTWRKYRRVRRDHQIRDIERLRSWKKNIRFVERIPI